jgi:type I restriction enzyme S subunit
VSSLNHQLPETWVKVRLADIVKPTRPKHSPQDFPALQFIGMENIEAHTMKLLGTVSASSMRSNAVHFQPGDVLYGRLRPYLNKVYCSNFEGLCSAEFIVFPPRDWIESKFLQYLLNSSGFVSFATHLNAGDRPRVDFDQIGEYQIPLVPVHEQKRIVAEIEKQFTRLDAAVAALKRVQANLKRYRAAVLKAACEGRLVPTEAELARREGRSYEPASVLLQRILAERRARWEAAQLGRFKALGKVPNDDKWKSKYEESIPPDSALSKLPEGWLWATLSQVSWNASYGTSEKCDYGWPGPAVLRIPNVASGKIDLTDIKHAHESHEFDESDTITIGDMLIVRTNGSRDLIGRSAVVQESFRSPHLFASYLIRYRLTGELSLLAWMRTIWDSPWNRAQIESLAATTAGQYNVSVGKLNGLPMQLPPADEMQRIAAEIDRRISTIDELEAQAGANLARAERLRQSILRQAFEGKLVPQDRNDEPATALLERIRGTAIPGCAPGFRARRNK